MDEIEADRLNWQTDDRTNDLDDYDHTDPTLFRTLKTQRPLTIVNDFNTRKAPTMQTAKFLNRNGDWSLFVQFSVTNIATGNPAQLPSPLKHPIAWEITNNQGKAVAKGTAPEGKWYLYGIKESDLIALLALTDGDTFTFYNRASGTVSDRFNLMTGWLEDSAPAQLEEYLTPAPTKTVKRKRA